MIRDEVIQQITTGLDAGKQVQLYYKIDEHRTTIFTVRKVLHYNDNFLIFLDLKSAEVTLQYTAISLILKQDAIRGDANGRR